ncbi:hypothetical protein ACLK2A_01820 [Escherichia coli]
MDARPLQTVASQMPVLGMVAMTLGGAINWGGIAMSIVGSADTGWVVME